MWMPLEVMTSDNPEDIDRAVIEVLKAAGRGGGLILATDHSFHMGIPMENIKRFISFAKERGTYPLTFE